MKLRTQLVIVFLFLSILPLSGIVLFSYSSSQRAFRQAVEKETAALASQMDTRMASIRDDLGRRIKRIGGLPFDTLVAASDSNADMAEDAAAVLAAELGDSAEFLDRIEWSADTAVPESFDREFLEPTAPTPPAPPTPAVAPVAPVPPVAELPDPPEPAAPATFVISIPRIEISANGEPVVVGTEEKTIVAPKGFDAASIKIDVATALEQAQRIAKSAEEMERQREELQRHAEDQAAIRRELRTVLVHEGSEYGVLKAQVREDAIVKKVLAGAAPESDDIAFAIDDEGTFLTASEEDKQKLSGLDVAAIREGVPERNENWVIATSEDEQTGLMFAVARPVRESLRQMRATAMNNFMWGLGLVTLALFGIVPVANHLTRDIETVMDGVDRIGRGDLDSPVEVRSSNEIGHLASAFNRMALDLKEHQQRLLDEERKGREREVERRVLELEYERKSHELEEARNFQLSLLPDAPPTHPDLEIAVLVRTATEVGGDYYDYQQNSDGSLTLAIGDATGHGARAGTMVTVVKSLFSGKVEGTGLSDFLDEGNRTIRQMGLERMAMALTVARFTPGRITIAAAGMPPVLVYRAATGQVDELQCEAPPLGSLSYEYQSLEAPLSPGDVVLMMTDGFPELENEEGDPIGYVALGSLFRDVATLDPSGILDAFGAEADRWTAGQPPSDDITFLAIRVRSA